MNYREHMTVINSLSGQDRRNIYDLFDIFYIYGNTYYIHIWYPLIESLSRAKTYHRSMSAKSTLIDYYHALNNK